MPCVKAFAHGAPQLGKHRAKVLRTRLLRSALQLVYLFATDALGLGMLWLVNRRR